jgi:hypothetical protein
VHDYAVRGARGAGGWLLIVACEMGMLPRKLLLGVRVTIWILGRIVKDPVSTCVWKVYGIVLLDRFCIR